MSSHNRPLIDAWIRIDRNGIPTQPPAFNEAQAVKSPLHVVFSDVRSIASAFIQWMRMQSDPRSSIDGFSRVRELIHSALEYHGWSMYELCVACRLDPMYADCLGMLYP